MAFYGFLWLSMAFQWLSNGFLMAFFGFQTAFKRLSMAFYGFLAYECAPQSWELTYQLDQSLGV